MAGLLDYFDSPNAQLGLGLLAAAAPRSDGAGFGQRLMEGVQSGQSMRDAQTKRKMIDMQMQEAKIQMEDMKRRREQEATIRAGMGQFFKPGQQALAPLMGDTSTGILPSAGRASAAPQFDASGAAQFLAQNGEYAQALPLLQSLEPKERTLSPGQVVFKGNQKLLEVPKEPKEVDPNKPFMFVDGKIVPNEAYQAFDLRSKRAGATNVSLSNVGPKAFETELGKMDADQLVKWRDGAMAAQSTLGSVKRLEDADAKGAYSGGAANLKMTVGSYINGLTGATPKGQVGSELYTAEANNLVLSQVKALGANPSNADVIFIQKTVPQLSTNAEARKALTQFMREKAQSAVGLYQRANAHARKNSGLGGFEAVEPTSDIDALLSKYNK